MTSSSPIYLDNNATTKPYPEVLEAMKPGFQSYYGNPSSVHDLGRKAKSRLDQARKKVADLLNAQSPSEIIFVSCATEANALVLRGMARNTSSSLHIITSSIEHPSILKTCEDLSERDQANVTFLPVNRHGVIDPLELEENINSSPTLVSIMTANNEVGSLQPIHKISTICKEHEAVFHSDAVQAMGKIPVDVQNPEVDLLSLSGHKFHGPRGIGVLVRKRQIDLDPLLLGGGQEDQLRSGTEPTPLADGLATAMEIVEEKREEHAEDTETLREYFWEKLHHNFGDAVVRNTPPKELSLPNTLNVSFLEKEADKMLIKLDLNDICVSAGAACHSGAIEVSHVLQAMDVPEDVARGSVRFSLSHDTTEEEINRTLSVLENIV